MMETRSYEPEWLDLGPTYYTSQEYIDCLEQLDRVGRYLGGDQATWSALRHMQPNSILDVGCGGGQFTHRLAEKFPQAQIVGIDLNPDAIAFAKAQNPLPNLFFENRALNEPDKSYDVVMATLVCHHMNDAELIAFIQNASRVAKKKVILNDLHRHALALGLFNLACPILFNNRVVAHDGPLSIRRAFKYQDWQHYLQSAGLTQYSISWHWAFRWLVEINCERT